MPTYLYRCPSCRSSRDITKKLIDLNRLESCYVCEDPMQRQVVAPMVKGDLPGYDCPVTGKWVEGRRAHEENLRQQGCRLLEPGETAAAARWREQQDEALDRKVEATAEEFVHKLPAVKREQLMTEMAAGADVAVVRS